MNGKGRTIRIEVDGYTRVMLTVTAVLLAAVVVSLWIDHGPGPEAAYAEQTKMANALEQRGEIIAEQRRTTAQLERIAKLLTSGEMKAQVVSKDAKSKEEKDAGGPPLQKFANGTDPR